MPTPIHSKQQRSSEHKTHGGPLPATRLTPKEKELARFILSGFSNKEIAARSGVSIKTVKNQLTTLFEKVGVSSRLQLAVYTMDNEHLLSD